MPKLETRKANEGDDSIWKDAVAVSKKDEEAAAYFIGKVSFHSQFGYIVDDLPPITRIDQDEYH